MTIQDKHMGWKTCRAYIPIQEFSFDNDGSDNISLAEGTPIIEAASGTLEQVVVKMTTADEVEVGMTIPWNLDRTKQVLARVYFIHAAVGADTGIKFALSSLFYIKQATTAEVKGGFDVAATATANTCSTTNDSLEVTDWFDLKWDTKITTDDLFVGVNLACGADGTAEGDEVELLGLELMWEIEACDDYRRGTDDALARNPV